MSMATLLLRGRAIVRILGLWAVTVLLFGCSESDESTSVPDHSEEEHTRGAVRLSAAEMLEFGVETGIAGPGKLVLEVEVPGEIALNGNRLAHIVPRFPGVVREVRKSVGDDVEAGDVLAIVESNEGLTPYELKSLISGTIIAKHIAVGEAHQGDVEAFLIADLDSVWANLSVFQNDMSQIAVGQRVTIRTERGGTTAAGVIAYISPVVDEHTRTATARVPLPNLLGEWRPGLFIDGRITVQEPLIHVLVPQTALQILDGGTCVFVQTPEGFIPRPIELGRGNEEAAEVVRGLSPGETYVTKGGFTLKAEMSKSEFEEGH